MQISVVIADDQPLVRSGFRNLVSQEDDLVLAGEAVDGVDAVGKAHRLRPDVLVMDLDMPRMDGIEATRRIASDPSLPTRVLVLTSFGREDNVYEALRSGASAFLLKDAPPDDLLGAVRTVAAGHALLTPSVTRSVIEHFVRSAPPRDDARVLELSEREREVLDLLCRGLSNAEIATALVVSGPTVKTHVAQILRKLHVRDRVQAVIYAYEAGFVRLGEGEPGMAGPPAPVTSASNAALVAPALEKRYDPQAD